MIVEPAKINEEIVNFYSKLYTGEVEWRPTGNISNCPRITEVEREVLQGDFEEQDVYNCLKMCAADKAPGPDGFTMGFYLKCREVLKHDIMRASHNFHSKEIFEKSSNDTYIALIPKKMGKRAGRLQTK